MMRSQLADSGPSQSLLLGRLQPQFKTIFGPGLITSWDICFRVLSFFTISPTYHFLYSLFRHELVEHFLSNTMTLCSIHILNQIKCTYSLLHDSYALLIVLLKQVQEDGSMHHNPS